MKGPDTSDATLWNMSGAHGNSATAEIELPQRPWSRGLAESEWSSRRSEHRCFDTSAQGTIATTARESPLGDSELGLKLHKVANLTSASDEAVRHVVGRKVVALLGQTGTSKSTVIHLVAG